MDNKTNLIKKINKRKSELIKISNNLKDKFVGIDHIIDSIIKNINVWYVLPEIIRRPIIINLWGMTGVGKTDLIRNLVREMNLTDKFVEIQMANKASGWKRSIQEHLSGSSINMEDPGILLLDEIQRYRTVDANGGEIHDHDFQDLWMLLSDGVFSNDSSTKEYLLNMIFGDAYQEDMVIKTNTSNSKTSNSKKKKRNFHRNYQAATILKKKLKRTEPIEEIMRWTKDKKTEILIEAIDSPDTYQGDNYNKLLIFISGNLDEVYKMASSTDDAEIDADIFHNFSSKINIITVKSALRKRFKPEQISRFGNTHIIYPSLSKGSYKEIIRRKIKEITDDVYKEHKVKIVIDQSVHNFIYRNGVFPAQGVRPVLSTILSTIANSIPIFLLSAIEQKEDKIEVRYEDKCLMAFVGIKIEKYCVEGDIDKIKKERNIEQKTITSVHEAGHSVAYSKMFELVPTQIVSNNSSNDIGGYIGLHAMVSSKDIIEKQMVVLLAGVAAEELVFGDDKKTSGSKSDLACATGKASMYIREYGMDGYNSVIKNPYSAQGGSSYNFDIKESNSRIESMIIERKKQATELLAQNKTFLIKVVETLIKDGSIKEEKYKELAEEYGMNLKILSTKDNVCEGYQEKFEAFKR